MSDATSLFREEQEETRKNENDMSSNDPLIQKEDTKQSKMINEGHKPRNKEEEMAYLENEELHNEYEYELRENPFLSPMQGHFKTNVYIRGLPKDVSNESLREKCATFGNIVSLKAITDPNVGCKGYGFVMFETEKEAQLCMETLNAEGMQASFARESFSAKLKKLQDFDSTNIYITNLPRDMTEEHLQDMLSLFGKVISCRILKSKDTMESRGVGFARMETREIAERVILHFHNKFLQGSLAPLQARFADSQAQKHLKRVKQYQLYYGKDYDGFEYDPRMMMMMYQKQDRIPMGYYEGMMVPAHLQQHYLATLPAGMSASGMYPYVMEPTSNATTTGMTLESDLSSQNGYASQKGSNGDSLTTAFMQRPHVPTGSSQGPYIYPMSGFPVHSHPFTPAATSTAYTTSLAK